MSHIQVDGPLHFERAAGVRGVLRYTGGGDPINLGITGADSPPSFAITGSGTLIAEGGTHAGRIENLGIGGTETLLWATVTRAHYPSRGR